MNEKLREFLLDDIGDNSIYPQTQLNLKPEERIRTKVQEIADELFITKMESKIIAIKIDIKKNEKHENIKTMTKCYEDLICSFISKYKNWKQINENFYGGNITIRDLRI